MLHGRNKMFQLKNDCKNTYDSPRLDICRYRGILIVIVNIIQSFYSIYANKLLMSLIHSWSWGQFVNLCPEHCGHFLHIEKHTLGYIPVNKVTEVDKKVIQTWGKLLNLVHTGVCLASKKRSKVERSKKWAWWSKVKLLRKI